MAAAQVANPQAGAGGQAAQGAGQGLFNRILNMVTIYFLMTYAASYFKPGGNGNDGYPIQAGTLSPLWPEHANLSVKIQFLEYCPANPTQVLNATMLTYTARDWAALSKKGDLPDDALILPDGKLIATAELPRLRFTHSDPEQKQEVELELLNTMEKNCTIVAEIEMTPLDKEIIDQHRAGRLPLTYVVRSLMTGWFSHRKSKEKNLFEDDEQDSKSKAETGEGSGIENADSAPDQDRDRIVHFIRPDLILNLVADWTKHRADSIPDQFKKSIRIVVSEEVASDDEGSPKEKNPKEDEGETTSSIEPGELRKEEGGTFPPKEESESESDDEPAKKKSSGSATDAKKKRRRGLSEEEMEEVSKTAVGAASPTGEPKPAFYYPFVYVNTFWTLKEHLLELNRSTVNAVNHSKTIALSYYPLGIFKYLIYIQMDASFDTQEAYGAMAKNEKDDTKRIFLDTNPILLGVTVIVSLLHLVFETLAFRNDVSFWRNKKDFKGLSVRSLMMNCYFQVVIFLYLLDGETSWSVLLPSGIGTLIEFWKLRKVIKIIPLDPEEQEKKKSMLPFRVEFEKSYKGKTKKYDAIALRWLFIVGTPFLIAYTIYSALYHSHKGWYSFIIRTQVRFIYFSGFVMMCPQIFINYKLKCVAHMPWRTFTYKALNTVIDDLFAFIIKMPTMHRLACFRDDVVFVILLYQRWIYPVNQQLTEDGDLPESDEEVKAIDGVDQSKAVQASPAVPSDAAETTSESKKDR